MSIIDNLKEYLKPISLFVLLGLISCSEDKDYSSPDLELITLNMETELKSIVNKELLINPVFENAVGKVSSIWTMDDTVLSRDNEYAFKPTELGEYFINLYVEDSEGKYANIRYKILAFSDIIPEDKNKVVAGYFLGYRSKNINWNDITHLIYGFIYPNSDGTLNTEKVSLGLDQYILDAKLNNTKILISIGGNDNYPGREDRIFTRIIANANLRAELVKNIKNFLINYKLDGIDIYYDEFSGGGETVNTNDAKKMLLFYKELRESLSDQYLLTTAITGDYNWSAYNYRDIAAEMTNVLDFISVRSFDYLGTWEESGVGPHSSVKDARNTLNRYVNFGITKEKLVLGIPFYGRDFLTSSGGIASAIGYSDILELYNPREEELLNGNLNRDGHNIFFNSQKVISKKINFLNTGNYKGIMIWELGQDTSNGNLKLTKDILSQLTK